MLQDATRRDTRLHHRETSQVAQRSGRMPVHVQGVQYYSIADLEIELNVSRQTIWRWRKDGHIPPGLRYRGNKVLFSESEAEAVRAYALRLEPIGGRTDQLGLFNGFR